MGDAFSCEKCGSGMFAAYRIDLLLRRRPVAIYTFRGSIHPSGVHGKSEIVDGEILLLNGYECLECGQAYSSYGTKEEELDKDFHSHEGKTVFPFVDWEDDF